MDADAVVQGSGVGGVYLAGGLGASQRQHLLLKSQVGRMLRERPGQPFRATTFRSMRGDSVFKASQAAASTGPERSC